MGFYQEIHANYGNVAVTTLKKWANTNIKMASFSNRRIFLLQCKRHAVFPDHITKNINCLFNNLEVEPISRSGRMDSINKRLKLKILKLDIEGCLSHLNSLNKDLKRFKGMALQILPRNIVNSFESRLKHNYNRTFSRIKRDNCMKFNKLITREKRQIVVQEKWLMNISGKPLPDEVTKTLALGPKFAYTPDTRQISMKHLLADVEFAISMIPEAEQNILRATATNIITNYMNKNKGTTCVSTSLLSKTKKFLAQNQDLLVTRSDKGNTTVVMKKEDYHNKIMELLQDDNVYREIQRDPTTTLQRKNNKFVQELKKEKHINDEVAKKLTMYKAVPPRLYGLPKIHKDNIPLRPIVSSINSPTGFISRWVSDILNQAFQEYNSYAVKNSFVFAEKINNFKLPEGYVLISLDVVSLFTNISIDLILKILEDEWGRISSITSVPMSSFLEIVKFIYGANYFKYEGKCYSMVFGLPMGSPVSPAIANIVMSALIRSSLQKLSFQTPFFYQYVDDLVTAVPLDQIEEILDTFNSFDVHLKFTVEKENENSVPFLDTRIIRNQDNNLLLDWYQKKTNSGRYVHYRSYHDIKMKTNVILALKDRIKKITHPTLYHSAIARLKDTLKKNGYPDFFLHRLLFNSRDRDQIPTTLAAQPPSIQTENQPSNEQEENPPLQLQHQRYVSFPYIVELTGKLVDIFRSHAEIKIAKYNLITNRQVFSKLKDKLPTLSRSDVVYEITCATCQGKYIGQCSTNLQQRISLHKSDSKLRPNRCNLASHVHNTGHTMNFEEIKILTQEKRYQKRVFLEMCYIQQCKSSINQRSDIDKLSVIYSSLLLHDVNKSGEDNSVGRATNFTQQTNPT